MINTRKLDELPLRPWSKPSVANAPEVTDEAWMDQALDQARQGLGLASPNPTVGCVIVKDGQLLGKGHHIYENRDHAEIVALRLSLIHISEPTRRTPISYA